MGEKMKKLMKLTLGLAAVLAFLTSAVSAEDDVRLRLNWMYYGSHAGFAMVSLWVVIQ